MAYNYWEERFKRLKTVEMRKAERANADLARVYRETLRQLRAEVEQWYDRFAKENKISLAEARRILDNRELKEFKMTLTDFIKEAKRLDLDPAHIRMLENASMRVRLTRSQEIYLKTAQYVEKLAKTQGWQLNGLMREVYTDSVYKTAYETQKVTGFENFRAVRERQIEEAISKPWAPDGADFSSRIWKNKTQLINSLQTDITQSLMTGTSTAQLSEKIAARFNTSYNQAYRLVETETAYIQERAMLDTYDELGLEQYQICAVLDSKTSEICQDLDGKVFDRKDAKPGITMPPFHCHCRSTTVPYIEGLLDDGGRVARDPETGKTVEIPDMTYKEWKEKYVKPADLDLPKGDTVINGLAEISKIKSNADIKLFAEQLTDNLKIDKTNITIRVAGIKPYGYCAFGKETTPDAIRYNEYVLKSTDRRSMTYRVKTAFHEAFHLMADGMEWDGGNATGGIKKSWRDLEETFTESAAHYMLKRYGVKSVIAPSYAQELATNLPLLKRLDKYAACNTIQDFGKIAFTDRQKGTPPKWGDLYAKMKQVQLPSDYYASYNKYIKENEDELFDMFFGNMPGYEHCRNQMKEELASAMRKNRVGLTQNENTVYYGILTCAMQKVGVK